MDGRTNATATTTTNPMQYPYMNNSGIGLFIDLTRINI